jgi:hypothetical protein
VSLGLRSGDVCIRSVGFIIGCACVNDVCQRVDVLNEGFECVAV